MFKTGLLPIALILNFAFSANAYAETDVDALFREAQSIIDAGQSDSVSSTPISADLVPLTGEPLAPSAFAGCTIGLSEMQAELDSLRQRLADSKKYLIDIAETYKTVETTVPLGSLTKCTEDLAAPIDALISDVAKIDFAPMRSSVQVLTACVVEHEGELNRQNDAYKTDPSILNSRDALLLSAKLKLVSDVSLESLDLSHEVERLDSKRIRLADAIATTRSFCVDDY